MLFGTFDMVHEGHKNLFQQARTLAKNPFLIVSLARDVNVKRIKNKFPENSERKRLSVIKKQVEVDQAVLGSLSDYIAHIVKYKPDIIALGYDQKAYTQKLKSNLRNAGLNCEVVRMKSYKPRMYKTSILKAKKLKAKS